MTVSVNQELEGLGAMNAWMGTLDSLMKAANLAHVTQLVQVLLYVIRKLETAHVDPTLEGSIVTPAQVAFTTSLLDVLTVIATLTGQ